ncbi:hypothetical protein [Amycolatopsis sp. NBC_01480]|uniref:hypothetical protein n=1 Tax=Amycolatopsis sp. NBC_01480 TaxID=2903562 RepID=UPI002E2946B9|nr:hypothetical protein [Amycolatopsis sp. NBC_01480]
MIETPTSPVRTGHERRVGTMDLAWQVGDYDPSRFKLHAIDEVVDSPSGDGQLQEARETSPM